MASKINDPNIISRLRPAFIKSLQTELPVLQQLLAALHRRDMTPDGFKTIERVVHDLAGAGSTFGFTAITDIGRALEVTFFRNPKDTSIAGLESWLSVFIETCQLAIEVEDTTRSIATLNAP